MPCRRKASSVNRVLLPLTLLQLATLVWNPPAPGQEPKAASATDVKLTAADTKPKPTEPVKFLRDVAPLLVRNCIACHNPKKSESKYVMTSFAQLVKGGKQGEGTTVVPGKPEESYFLELLEPDAEPRMPYKLDPLTRDEISMLERWVAEGAKYDGTSPTEDWTFLMRKTQTVAIPDVYPVAVPITALAFSPDSQKVAASGFHEVTFWKTSDGALDHRLRGLSERVYGIASSPNGKWLATASGDPGQYGLARQWSAEPSGGAKPLRDLAESQDAVFAVAFSPDGKRLATAGADRVIRLFDAESGKLQLQIEDHADWIFDIAFSPDGKRLASASRDKTSKVFDVEQKESLATFTGHGQPVYTVAFSSDGKTVRTGGEDARVRIWSFEGEAKQVREIGDFAGPVFKLRNSPDNKTMAVCSGDKTVRILKSENGATVHKLDGHSDWVYTVAFSGDGKVLASGSWDGEVRLWNTADGKAIRTILAAPGFKPGNTQAKR